MKKVKLLSILGSVSLLIAFLFLSGDVLANSNALEEEYETRTVTCFKTITEDSSTNPPFVFVYSCDDCKQCAIISALETNTCIAKFAKKQTEIN